MRARRFARVVVVLTAFVLTLLATFILVFWFVAGESGGTIQGWMATIRPLETLITMTPVFAAFLVAWLVWRATRNWVT